MERIQELSRQYLDSEITAKEYRSSLVTRLCVSDSDEDMTALAYQLTLADHAKQV